MAKAMKIVALTGAGISAESGLPTYRGADGLWREHRFEELASPEGFKKHPQDVLDFYNERRYQAWHAQPNAAHQALADLQQQHSVVIITQNVDALHEKAGSKKVIHLHGELAWARSVDDPQRRIHLKDQPISVGDTCDDDCQLRPDVVWFGEAVRHYDIARLHVAEADILLVIGTSLAVYPAAYLADEAPAKAKRILINPDQEANPGGFTCIHEPAGTALPPLARDWMAS